MQHVEGVVMSTKSKKVISGLAISCFVALSANAEDMKTKAKTVTSEPPKATMENVNGPAAASSADRTHAMADSKKAVDGGNIPARVIQDAERALSNKGFKISNIDGKFDSETEVAIKKFQKDNDLVQTGRLNSETLDELDVDFDDALEARNERQEYSE